MRMDLKVGEKMEEILYSLMHRDDPVCAISIDAVSGAILRVSKPVNPELLPLGGSIDSAMLKKWWQRRAVPVGQGKIQRILEQMGISTPQEYLVKNLGLSLTDHYWIKPLDMEFGWADINLFTNDFRAALNAAGASAALGFEVMRQRSSRR